MNRWYTGDWQLDHRVRRSLSDWVLANTWSLGTLHQLFVPSGVLGCKWQRTVEVTDHYKRVVVDSQICVENGGECQPAREWMSFAISTEDETRSFAYTESRIMTANVWSGFLPTRLLRVMLCLQLGPPRM